MTDVFEFAVRAFVGVRRYEHGERSEAIVHRRSPRLDHRLYRALVLIRLTFEHVQIVVDMLTSGRRETSSSRWLLSPSAFLFIR